MAFSEEDGSNGGASEASEEREAPGRRRRLGWAATAWLTFYNIAMTAGYVRPEAPGSPAPALPAPPRPLLRARGGHRLVGGPAPERAVGRAGVCAGRGAGGPGAGGAGGAGAVAGTRWRPWGRGAGAGGGLNGAGRGSPCAPGIA